MKYKVLLSQRSKKCEARLSGVAHKRCNSVKNEGRENEIVNLKGSRKNIAMVYGPFCKITYL